MYELESAKAALRHWATRQDIGPADPDDMTEEELGSWWADEALHGADLARRLLAVLDAPEPPKRRLVPGEEDAELVCPDCGGDLSFAVEETDYRRGATWLADGSIIVGKSNSVETIEARIFCRLGHGEFEVPDIADWS